MEKVQEEPFKICEYFEVVFICEERMGIKSSSNALILVFTLFYWFQNKNDSTLQNEDIQVQTWNGLDQDMEWFGPILLES